MEAIAAPLALKVAKMMFHEKADVNVKVQEHFATQLFKVRLFAKVGQADVDFRASKFQEVSVLVDPILAESRPAR